MLQLELSKQNATLVNVNLRTEKTGDEKVPAADLRITVPQSADVLAHFSPTLKGFLFDEKGPRDLADGLPLRDTHLVYPLSRDEEMTGAEVEIGYGPGKPMKITDCKVNSFRLTPMQGGSVVVGLRVQCRPSAEQVARLYELQENGIEFTLKPLELPTMGAEAA